MVQSLDIAKAHAEKKLFTVIKKGGKLDISEITHSEVKISASLQKAYLLMVTLSKNPTLTEFAFVLEWPKLKVAEKREKYSKYACHELNFFIYHKDPEFFNEVVKPYIANKKDKTFMDEWLLGANLEKYLEPFAFSQLNDVEKILLARRGPAELAKMRRYIQDKRDLIAPNPEQFNRLFNTAIKSSALDANGDKLCIKKGKDNAMLRFRDQLSAVTGKRQGQAAGGGLAMPGNGPATVNALMPRPTSSAAPTVAAQAAEQKAGDQNLDEVDCATDQAGNSYCPHCWYLVA